MLKDLGHQEWENTSHAKKEITPSIDSENSDKFFTKRAHVYLEFMTELYPSSCILLGHI